MARANHKGGENPAYRPDPELVKSHPSDKGEARAVNLKAMGSANFRTYFFSNMFALNATWMQRVTVGWIAWDMTGAAGFVGLVALLQFLPTILLGPVFGVWVDRIDVRRAARLTQAGLFTVSLSLCALAALDWLGPVSLIALTMSAGGFVAMHNPVRMSMAPRLVAREDLSSLINLTSINFNMARMIGPAIGGFTIAWLGVAQSLLLQTLFYLPFLVALSFLKVRPRRHEPDRPEAFGKAFQQGLRHVLDSPLVWQAMLVTGAMTLVARGTLEVLPPLADGVFEQGASGLGVLTSSAGLGAILAGFAKAVLPPQPSGRLPRTALVAALLALLLVPVLGMAPSWEFALACVACLGFASTTTAVTLQTAIQLELDDALRGRVMSLWVMIAMGGAALGAGIIGALSDLIGFSLALGTVGGTAAALLLGFIVLIVLRR